MWDTKGSLKEGSGWMDRWSSDRGSTCTDGLFRLWWWVQGLDMAFSMKESLTELSELVRRSLPSNHPDLPLCQP